MKRFMIVPLLLVLLVSFSAHAKPGKSDWQWWNSTRITNQIDLTEAQSTQINEIAAKFDPTLKEARETFMTNKLDFKAAKSNPSTSSGDVIKAFDTMWDSKYKMKRIKLDRDLEIKSVLTPEQTTELVQIREAYKEKTMKKYHKKHHKQLEEKTSQ